MTLARAEATAEPADRCESVLASVVRVLNKVAKRCSVQVADRGPGLSPEQTAQAGRRFWRGDQGRQRKDGGGLVAVLEMPL